MCSSARKSRGWKSSLKERPPGEFGQAVEQGAVEAEEDADTLGDGPDELTMGNVEADVLGDVEGEEGGHGHAPLAIGVPPCTQVS
jgi:acetyl-CoA acetyltransferase